MNAAVFPSSAETTVGSAQTSAPPRAGASWSAIIAGAFVATSASVILLALGSGIGFASLSAWSSAGALAKALTVNAAIWLIVSQWLSSALGGYIAGRLRTRWLGTHAHEVFFRDTAQGLITWSVATVFVAALLSIALWSVAGGSSNAASTLAASAPPRAPDTYAIDLLFRPGPNAPSSSAPVPRAEIDRILGNAAVTAHFPDSDRAYLADLVVARTGLTAPDAQKRVDLFVAGVQNDEARARATAEKLRKDAEVAALYVALSLVVGAFVASVSAALGGRLRDLHP
jgi:hypothetical protein